jgi:hypothetical protein
MTRWFKQLDEILRGDATGRDRLREGRLDIPVGGILFVIVILAAFYGLCMGVYAMIRTHAGSEGWMQLVASAVKLPLLFLLTLFVTLPSLYVFNAIVGSRLTVMSVLRLLAAMLGVMLAVLASLGPIVAFFAVSTANYPFMKLLNVVMATIAGLLGLAFLLRTRNAGVAGTGTGSRPTAIVRRRRGRRVATDGDATHSKTASVVGRASAAGVLHLDRRLRARRLADELGAAPVHR